MSRTVQEYQDSSESHGEVVRIMDGDLTASLGHAAFGILGKVW